MNNDTKQPCVLRLKTKLKAHKSGGLTIKRKLKSATKYWLGYSMLEDELDNTSPEEVVGRIINFMTCADGLYTMVPCHKEFDRETGYLEDYDLRLVPFTEEEESA
jgi:hypothetical protein